MKFIPNKRGIDSRQIHLITSSSPHDTGIEQLKGPLVLSFTCKDTKIPYDVQH